MTLFFLSFFAGVLSVLAPCVIGLMPVLLARSSDGSRKRSPFFVIGGLAASIFIFSILLKASTSLIGVPTSVWEVISGIILILFGVTYVFPHTWEYLSQKLGLAAEANRQSAKAFSKNGKLGDIVLGASLGPVFSACSPTYALIVASILPATPVKGVLYLLAFVAGLSSILALIAVLGSKLTTKLGWGINPNGWFKRTLGIIFILFGLLIATGAEKQVQSYVVQQGWFDWQIKLESNLQQ